MMLKKHALFSIALLSSASLYAIPIESRGLSDTASSRNDVANSPAPIAGNMNWDLIQKNQQLENQIRELRGKIEEQDHAIDQLNKELTNRYTDLDQRLELLNQKLEPESNQPEQAPAENAPVDSSTATDQTSTASKATTNSPAPTTAQNPATPANSSNNTSDPVALEKAAYTIALDAYKKGGAKQAIAPMQNFIKNYPNSIYTGNAYFWLAEFQLAIDPPNYNEAKKNYEIVAAKFPNSSKAPRALYQLYSIAKDVNKNTQTANVYKSKLLSTYPKSEEAGFFKKG
ncbi:MULTISPECIES: YbgF trimerization domain-containing protein [Acinetobacter]|uniref:YbgF trimerization domain-containing protein n=1 Tax=Acinetobacter TaxID=469 RepID=UPI0004D81FB6|nr:MULTISPECIES: YbgF trimerization domain-containing protein [Acinetobacter]KEC84550.1 signal peptide protein [Acinetobacter sp. ETR1]MDO6643917.1 YbgF trimerization domain-containing protein [Acinetobacter guillouiae]WEE41747.1 YbgF trimerization domain-containing protein [Acinetobacter sp. TAC-1]